MLINTGKYSKTFLSFAPAGVQTTYYMMKYFHENDQKIPNADEIEAMAKQSNLRYAQVGVLSSAFFSLCLKSWFSWIKIQWSPMEIQWKIKIQDLTLFQHVCEIMKKL